MRSYNFLLIFIFLVSCSTPRALYDYDDQVNFSNFRTYSIYPELQTGLSQLDDNRLITSLESALRSKGFSPSENPDLYVNIYSEEFRESNQSRLGVGVGGGRGNVGVGISGGIPLGGADTYLRLTFDLIDAKKDALVWQAVVESSFDPNASPEIRQKKFDLIVAEALKGYPPRK